MIKPVSIYIERDNTPALKVAEIKYTLKTLLTVIGIPWRFLDKIPSTGVDIHYGPRFVKSRIFIRQYNSDRLRPLQTEPRIAKNKELIFLLFNANESPCNIVKKDKEGNTQILSDIIYSSFYILTGLQEKFIQKKGWDIHILDTSFLYKNNLLHFPLVNLWAELIHSALPSSHCALQTWPNNKKFAIALTHDVDYPQMLKFVEVLRYISKHRMKCSFKTILDIISGKENFWKFDDWIEIEKRYNLRSAFYFSGFRGNLLRYFFIAPDPFYDLSNPCFREAMLKIKENGFEIGMHASYLSYQSSDEFKAEKNKVEKAADTCIYGNRHHYWHINHDAPYETAQVHTKAGLMYDSSMGFEMHSGFRRGICSPYRLYDSQEQCPTRVLQIPPVLMDSHIFHYEEMNSFSDYKEHINSLIFSVRKFSGVFTVDFHVRVLNNLFFKDWDKAYIYLLEKLCSSCEYYCDTPENLARHWLDREDLLERASKDEISCSN